MKRIAFPLVAILMFLSACASPATSTSTPAPAEQTKVIPTPPSAGVVPVESTTTSTPEPTPTSTPVPPSARWYWAVDDSGTPQVIAVNQFGERRELGALDQSDDLHTIVTALDPERALLFLDSNENLRIYLLTSDKMQKISLPFRNFYFNTGLSQVSRSIVAVHEDKVVFSYITIPGSNIRPDTGPLFLVDLTALTAELIDETVNLDGRTWFHLSQDSRYLRYRNGERGDIKLRELDLATGEVRTLYTTDESPFDLRGSPRGDLWFQRTDNLFFDLQGNQTTIKDTDLAVRLLDEGNALIFPRNCVDECALRVTKPLQGDDELGYLLPWTIQDGTTFAAVTQLLPDQSLLFAGDPYGSLPGIPVTMEMYPGLLENDRPLFRLTTDGQARLVGIYTGTVSQDRRYILLRAPDQNSYFMYDAVADRTLFDIPIDTSLQGYEVFSVQLFDEGILVNLSAGENGVYRFFSHAYVYKTSESIGWEDVNAETSSCIDLLEDATLVCWFYPLASANFDLIRFSPADGTRTTLLEDVWSVDFR